MPKNSKKTIPLGSGDLYIDEVPGTLPATAAAWVTQLTTSCVEAKLAGKIKSGASLEYSEETYTEKSDDGTVVKVITVEESGTLKAGLIAWNAETLHTLIDRSKVETVSTGSGSTAKNYRVTKLGGKGNEQDVNYLVIFHHHDAKDGGIWVVLVGRNTSPITIAFAKDAGSLIEPTFTATPLDDDGTCIVYIEELDDGSSGT